MGGNLTAGGQHSSLRSMRRAPGGCPGGQSLQASGSACAVRSRQRSGVRSEVDDAATGGACALLRRLNTADAEERRDCGLLHQQLADALQPQSCTAGHRASAARSHHAR